MTLLEFINIIYIISAFFGLVCIAYKKSIGFAIFLIAECCMFYIGYKGNQFGVSTMAVIYFFTNIWAYIKWEKS